MIYIIKGKQNSGKSQKAENLCVSLKKQDTKLLYIATLSPNAGGDTKKRIQKHKDIRKGKGFFVIQTALFKHKDLTPAILHCKKNKKKGYNTICLLEDLNNLSTNLLFSKANYTPCLLKVFFVFCKITMQIKRLCKIACHIIIVINEWQPNKAPSKYIKRYIFLLKLICNFLQDTQHNL